MHRYLMAVRHFFSGYQYFEIEADNKAEAFEKASVFVRKSGRYGGGNFDYNDIICVKKIQVKKKKRGE